MSADTGRPVVVYHHRTQGVDAQGIHVREMCRAFARIGYRVAKVALHADEQVGRDSRPGLLSRLVSRLPPLAYELLELGYNLVGIPRLYRTVRRERPAFLYERYCLSNLSGVVVSRLTGVPLVLEVNSPLAREKAAHGGLAFPRLAQALETWIVNHADRTVAVSEVLRRMLVEKGADAARITVMHNGVNPEDFAGLEIREPAGRATVRVGFTGWFRPWHGLAEMVAALDDQGLFASGLEVVLVGDGPVRPELERLVRERSLEGRVAITGPVDRETLVGHLAAMDIAVQPAATAYASPMKLFEYLAAGKAVVAPDQDNIREVVRDGVEAVLFPPGDFAGFARRVEELAKDPGLRQRLGEAGRRSMAAGRRTWEENAARVAALVAAPAA
ncbi:glycosyl transferase group 1 [Solidesulfovibrio carbinoliphilus subsp. oakridgensis]|uniref:Glycosyl transferase group 1 n=1 Tax=Solidesulfovibrio carbinoliphilus subsp. oakridgensis TaxID=694327 RepID=G7QCG9_9BACT|nr:glycosyltransferase family 4 protein [Solidesulfovibrio carbinoliphilus]EHJ46125.1 glycosyl transferase group 1 [Solidesulfovibrio carbinoliphilus subsp. oakridgensis]